MQHDNIEKLNVDKPAVRVFASFHFRLFFLTGTNFKPDESSYYKWLIRFGSENNTEENFPLYRIASAVLTRKLHVFDIEVYMAISQRSISVKGF